MELKIIAASRVVNFIQQIEFPVAET